MINYKYDLFKSNPLYTRSVHIFLHELFFLKHRYHLYLILFTQNLIDMYIYINPFLLYIILLIRLQ